MGKCQIDGNQSPPTSSSHWFPEAAMICHDSGYQMVSARVPPGLQLRMDHGAHTVMGYLSPSHHRARPSLSWARDPDWDCDWDPDAWGWWIGPWNESHTWTHPRCSMYGIFTYIWVIFGVNVGKYSIHGAYGHGDLWKLKRVVLLNLRRMAHGVTAEDDWLVHQIWVIQRPIPGKNPWPSSCLSSLYTQWSSDDSWLNYKKKDKKGMKSMAQMRLDLWNTNSVAMRSVWICVRNLRHGKKHGTEILSYFRDLFDIHSRNIGNTLEHHADPLRIPNQARWRHGFLNAICGSSSAATNATNEPLIYHIYTYTGVHHPHIPYISIYLCKNGCGNYNNYMSRRLKFNTQWYTESYLQNAQWRCCNSSQPCILQNPRQAETASIL